MLVHLGNRQFLPRCRVGRAQLVHPRRRWPGGTGPYKLVEGVSTPDKRSTASFWKNRTTGTPPGGHGCSALSLITHSTNTRRWSWSRRYRADMVAELSPLETLRVSRALCQGGEDTGRLGECIRHVQYAQADSPWRDGRLRQAANLAINRDDLIRYATKGNAVVIPALLPAQALAMTATSCCTPSILSRRERCSGGVSGRAVTGANRPTGP